MSVVAPTIYRLTNLGEALKETIDMMIEEDKLSSELKSEILAEYDDVMYKTLNSLTRDDNVKVSGEIEQYRIVESFAHIVLKNSRISTNENVLSFPKLEIWGSKSTDLTNEYISKHKPTSSESDSPGMD